MLPVLCKTWKRNGLLSGIEGSRSRKSPFLGKSATASLTISPFKINDILANTSPCVSRHRQREEGSPIIDEWAAWLRRVFPRS